MTQEGRAWLCRLLGHRWPVHVTASVVALGAERCERCGVRRD